MWSVTLTTGLLTAAGAFFSPAYAASLSGLVHPADLTTALSTFQIMRQTIQLVGPSITGILIAAIGRGPTLWLDALSFFISALCVFVLRLRWAPRPPKHRRPFWQDFRGGLKVIFGNPTIVRIVALSLGVTLVGGVFVVLLPVVALREFARDAVR